MARPDRTKIYLDRLREYYLKSKKIPNFRDLKEVLWVQSTGSVTRFFKKLTDEWFFEKEWHSFIPQAKFLNIPVYESIQAGFASPATEENNFDIDLENYIMEHPNTSILVKVKWDSMQDAGILEWDIVIVDKSLKAQIWDIIVAIVDHEYTLKFLKKDKKWKFYLHPANNNYPDIYPENQLEIFWVVVSVVRKIRSR